MARRRRGAPISLRVTRIHQPMISPATLPGIRETPAQTSLRPDHFLIGCVAENRPTFLRRAHLLIRSIRWFGGQLDGARLMVCVVDGVDPHFQYLLEEEGAEVRIVRRFDARNPFANKLQFFPEAFETSAEMLMLVDCDTVFVQDPLPLIRPDVFQAKIADLPTVPHQTFVDVFRHYGLELPPVGHATTFGATPTIAYCNSGVVILPTSLARDFVPVWREWNARLAEDLDLLGPYRGHCNQASLSVALAITRVPFREAPLALNFPLHLAHLDSNAELLKTDPVILHYHDRVAADGRLLPAPYPPAERRIEELNERVVANEAPRALGAARSRRAPARAPVRSAASSRDSARSSPLLILGMHRGGTSAAAQAIARLRVPFTRVSDLMPPSPENPTGYWESTVLSLFNDDVLQALGGSWAAPPSLARGWERGSSLQPLRELGRSLVETVHTTRRWAWKDPRNSILLPFWIDVLGIRPSIVLVHRNPLETWRSLAARGGFSKPFALALWERYMRSALENARGFPTLIVPYDGLLEDFAAWSTALSTFLDCDEGRERKAAIDRPLDESLRHSIFDAQDVARDPTFSLEQRRLFAIIEELLGEHRELEIPELPAEAPSTQQLFAQRLAAERVLDEQILQPSSPGPALEGIEEHVELNDLARPGSYRAYLAARRLIEDENRTRLGMDVGRFEASFRISVLVGVRRPNPARLERALQSVRAQIQPNWQLCLCDDAGNDDEATRALASAASEDDRILVLRHESPRGVAAAWNTALAAAQGEFVAFLDAEDALAPECLAEVTLALARDPRAELLYTDEDRIDDAGTRFEPFLKPGWSPDYLLSCAYLGRLLVVRRSLLERIGGLRSEYDGAAEYDLMLRATEATHGIVHLPKVLCHRGGGSHPLEAQDPQAARRALQSALARRNEDAEVEPTDIRGGFRVRRAIRRRPSVSVIIPFRDQARLLERCVRSIHEFAGYEPWDALLVDNGSWEPETKAVLRRLAADAQCRVLPYTGTFNWSAINNEAVRRSQGELLLFLNNDVESRQPGWLAAMIEHALRKEIGAVGGRLLYPNGMVQHAGVMLHPEALARHPFRFLPAGAPGYFGMAKLIRNCTAVTGACMMVRRELFEELGGFDESLPLVFNDIDFCLRALERGYRIVYTPYAELTHHESLTRGIGHEPSHAEAMRRMWGDRIRNEAYVSPNLPWHAAHASRSEGAK